QTTNIVPSLVRTGHKLGAQSTTCLNAESPDKKYPIRGSQARDFPHAFRFSTYASTAGVSRCYIADWVASLSAWMRHSRQAVTRKGTLHVRNRRAFGGRADRRHGQLRSGRSRGGYR